MEKKFSVPNLTTLEHMVRAAADGHASYHDVYITTDDRGLFSSLFSTPVWRHIAAVPRASTIFWCYVLNCHTLSQRGVYESADRLKHDVETSRSAFLHVLRGGSPHRRDWPLSWAGAPPKTSQRPHPPPPPDSPPPSLPPSPSTSRSASPPPPPRPSSAPPPTLPSRPSPHLHYVTHAKLRDLGYFPASGPAPRQELMDAANEIAKAELQQHAPTTNITAVARRFNITGGGDRMRIKLYKDHIKDCLLYTSPSPRD